MNIWMEDYQKFLCVVQLIKLCIFIFITGPTTHIVEARLVTVAGICRRL